MRAAALPGCERKQETTLQVFAFFSSAWSLAQHGLQNPQGRAKYDLQGLLQLPMGKLMRWQGQHSSQKASLSC